MEQKKLILQQSLQTQSIVTQVVNQITDAMIAGELNPGDKLPTESELCLSLGVGRNSVREAIKILEAYGVISIKRPGGTFVNDTYEQKMLDPMLYGILLRKNSGESMVQLRKVLDMGTMQVILPMITGESLAELHAAWERLGQAVTAPEKDGRKILEADIAFHMSITRASHNDLLLNMYSYVDRITIPSRTHAIDQMLAEGNTERFLALHKQMLDMIENKDFTHMETTIDEHYMLWKKIVSTEGKDDTNS